MPFPPYEEQFMGQPLAQAGVFGAPARADAVLPSFAPVPMPVPAPPVVAPTPPPSGAPAKEKAKQALGKKKGKGKKGRRVRGRKARAKSQIDAIKQKMAQRQMEVAQGLVNKLHVGGTVLPEGGVAFGAMPEEVRGAYQGNVAPTGWLPSELSPDELALLTMWMRRGQQTFNPVGGGNG